MKKLILKIYDSTFLISSRNVEIIERLRKDFSFFVAKDLNDSFNIVQIYDEEVPNHIYVENGKTWKSRNGHIYDKDKIRITDYGKAISRVNFETGNLEVWSKNIEHLHEISYLYILSKSGKDLDLKGVHRIHAMGFSYQDEAFIFSMDMGGGKSTLLSSLLGENIKFLSDDTPLIDSSSKVLPFPIRLGSVDHIKERVFNPDVNIYSLDRMKYGLKRLICLEGLDLNFPEEALELNSILFGRRMSYSEPRIYKISKVGVFCKLFGPLIVGVGLPIIFEYFWESGFRDFIRKSKIAISRIKISIKTSALKPGYIFEMTDDIEKNRKYFVEWIKSKSC